MVHAGAILWFADVTASVLVLGDAPAAEGMKGFPLAITINQTVAEDLAVRLGYPCVSREDIFNAAREFGVPESELSSALVKPPGFLLQSPGKRITVLNIIRSALLRMSRGGNRVYHGFSGHLLLIWMTLVILWRSVKQPTGMSVTNRPQSLPLRRRSQIRTGNLRRHMPTARKPMDGFGAGIMFLLCVVLGLHQVALGLAHVGVSLHRTYFHCVDAAPDVAFRTPVNR